MGGYWWLVALAGLLAFIIWRRGADARRLRKVARDLEDAVRPSRDGPQARFSKPDVASDAEAFRLARAEKLRRARTEAERLSAAFEANELEAGDGPSFRIVASMSTSEMPRENRPMPPRGSVSGASFEITYADADGVITERVIRVNEVTGDNGFAYIRAHCYLAQAERTFRSDRILELRNHRTGEQIRDPGKFFAVFYEDDDDEVVLSHEAVMSRAKPGLQALVWVARADGELDDAVIDTMLDYIDARRQIGSKAADFAWNREVAKRWIMFTRPVFDNAAGVLSRLSPAGRVAIVTREFVERIGATSPNRRKRADKLLRRY